MNAFASKTSLLALVFSAAAFAADATPPATTAPTAPATEAMATPAPAPATVPAAKPVTEEMIRARLAEHIKAKATAKSTATATVTTTAPVTPTATTQPPASAPLTLPLAATEFSPLAPSAKKESPEVLPKVEVRRSRTTAIEKEVFEQERDIAREKLKTKSTDVDKALNGSGKSKTLSIFGGESTKQRETVASERVSLMESERDIMEAIAYAKTKEEKDALRKELNEIKSLRRDLEASLR